MNSERKKEFSLTIDVPERHKRIERIEPCCEQMSSLYRSEAAGFGQKYDGVESDVNNYVNIYAYDFDDELWTSFPISFCPFCGCKIRVKVTRDQDEFLGEIDSYANGTSPPPTYP